MAEKYWRTPEALAQQAELPLKLTYEQQDALQNGRSGMLMHEPNQEIYWVDATEEELIINVHQSYFDIANAARNGGELSLQRQRRPKEIGYDQLQFDIVDYSYENSWFIPRTDLNQEEWASLVMPWSHVYRRFEPDEIEEVNEAAITVIEELDWIIHEINERRHPSGAQTPQLIEPYFGTLTLGGQISGAAKVYFREHSPQTQEDLDNLGACKVVRSLAKLAFENLPVGCQANPMPDGRFIANTGWCMGTGSLEVMPDKVERYHEDEDGYQYTSHNLDNAMQQLWAFAGLARLIGDAHRHYAAQTENN